MIQHPWHEVQIGERAPQIVNAVVEIPRGSPAKYEIDKASGLIRLDRTLHGSMVYPTHYGIIPQTVFDDGDPLDILLLLPQTVVPLTLVYARVVGVMRMIDQGIDDHKIIAVADNDHTQQHIQDIQDLDKSFLAELRDFFENYTNLEGKIVTVPDFWDKNKAFQVIEQSQKMYRQLFVK
jgi:inorganic pyrophosphatase